MKLSFFTLKHIIIFVLLINSAIAAKPGVVACWGSNQFSLLGIPQSDRDSKRGSYGFHQIALSAVAKEVAVGMSHACALLENGEVYCWGRNRYGQLGNQLYNGTIIDSYKPLKVDGLPSKATSIQAGYFHTCALLDTGEGYCWGLNTSGQLGDGLNDFQFINYTPQKVHGLSNKIKQITLGQSHTCALLETGDIYCWGLNQNGQLGSEVNYETTQPIDTPLKIESLGDKAYQISTGTSHTCALLNNGNIECWGKNESCQLGSMTDSKSSYRPLKFTLNNGVIKKLSLGQKHSCAVTLTGKILCWGDNSYAQFGNMTTGNISYDESRKSCEAISVVEKSEFFVDVVASINYTCGKSLTSEVCWGGNSYGQTGSYNNVGLPNGISQPLNVIHNLGNKKTLQLINGSYTFLNCAIAGKDNQIMN